MLWNGKDLACETNTSRIIVGISYMWQSRVEIEHYFVAYFDHVTALQCLSAELRLRVGLVRVG